MSKITMTSPRNNYYVYIILVLFLVLQFVSFSISSNLDTKEINQLNLGNQISAVEASDPTYLLQFFKINTYSSHLISYIPTDYIAYGKFSGSIISALILFILFKSLLSMVGNKYGTIITGIIAFNPYFVLLSNTVYPEIYLALSLSLILFFLIRNPFSKNQSLWLLPLLLSISLLIFTNLHLIFLTTAMLSIWVPTANRKNISKYSWYLITSILIFFALYISWDWLANTTVPLYDFINVKSQKNDLIIFREIVKSFGTILTIILISAISLTVGELFIKRRRFQECSLSIVFLISVSLPIIRAILTGPSDTETYSELMCVIPPLGLLSSFGMKKILIWSSRNIKNLGYIGQITLCQLNPVLLMIWVLILTSPLLVTLQTSKTLNIGSYIGSQTLVARFQIKDSHKPIIELSQYINTTIPYSHIIASDTESELIGHLSGIPIINLSKLENCNTLFGEIKNLDTIILVENNIDRSLRTINLCHSINAKETIKNHLKSNFFKVTDDGLPKSITLLKRKSFDDTSISIKGVSLSKTHIDIYYKEMTDNNDFVMETVAYQEDNCEGVPELLSKTDPKNKKSISLNIEAHPEYLIINKAGHLENAILRIRAFDLKSGYYVQSPCLVLDKRTSFTPPTPLLLDMRIQSNGETLLSYFYGGLHGDKVVLKRYKDKNCEKSIENTVIFQHDAYFQELKIATNDMDGVPRYYKIYGHRNYSGKNLWSFGSNCLKENSNYEINIIGVNESENINTIYFDSNIEGSGEVLLRRFSSIDPYFACDRSVRENIFGSLKSLQISDHLSTYDTNIWYQLYVRPQGSNYYIANSKCIPLSKDEHVPLIKNITLINGSINVEVLQDTNQKGSISLVSYSSLDCADSGTIKSTSHNNSSALVDNSPNSQAQFYGIVGDINGKKHKGLDCINIYDSNIILIEDSLDKNKSHKNSIKVSVNDNHEINISITDNKNNISPMPFLFSYDSTDCLGEADIVKLNRSSNTKYTATLENFKRNFKFGMKNSHYFYMSECMNISPLPIGPAPKPVNLQYFVNGSEYVKVTFNYYGNTEDEILIRSYLDKNCEKSVLYSHYVTNIENNKVTRYLPIKADAVNYFKVFSTRNVPKKYTPNNECSEVNVR